MFQLPSSPTAARVRTWRRLVHLGALPVKNSGYVLPNSSEAREDFEWLRADIRAAGGDALVFEAKAVAPADHDDLRRGFTSAIAGAFDALAKDAAQLRRRRAGAARDRLARRVQDRLALVDRQDFFGAGAALSTRSSVVAALEAAKEPHVFPDNLSPLKPSDFQRRVWVTRPRPGIDRFASAWLISKYIDPRARFEFADSLPGPRSRFVAFDMFGAELGHADGGCTLDTLMRRFGIDDPSLTELAALVRAVDLKVDDHPEAETVGRMVEGLRSIHADDGVLLQRGMEMIDALARSVRPAGRIGRKPRARSTR